MYYEKETQASKHCNKTADQRVAIVFNHIELRWGSDKSMSDASARCLRRQSGQHAGLQLPGYWFCDSYLNQVEC